MKETMIHSIVKVIWQSVSVFVCQYQCVRAAVEEAV